MTLTTKAKAFAFAALLLLVSTAMVGTAIAATGSVLKPFAKGQGFAGERPMTRGHHVALAVLVGHLVDEQIQPLQGATVSIWRTEGGSVVLVGTQTTGRGGGAILDIKPGSYRLTISKDNLSASRDGVIGSDLHVGVYFDANGEAHWKILDHRELESRGHDLVGLLVRVMENNSGRPAPVPDATVTLYHVSRDGSRQFVRSGATGARGFVAFQPEPGTYVVTVTTANQSAEHELKLVRPMAIGVLFNGSHADWRTGRPA